MEVAWIVIGNETDMCRNLIEIESEKHRKWVGHATEKGRKFEATALKNEKGEPTATLFHHEFGRYVTVISRDITSIIQCLRWCKTECAACTPCLKSSMCEFGRVDTVLLGVFTHTPPEGGDTNRSKPHQQNRSQQFKPKPKEANPINRPESNS